MKKPVEEVAFKEVLNGITWLLQLIVKILATRPTVDLTLSEKKDCHLATENLRLTLLMIYG